METLNIQKDQKVLLAWGSNTDPEKIKSTVDKIADKIGANGTVQVENVDRLLLANHAASCFDVCVSGTIEPMCTVHSQEALAEMLRIIKPSGMVLLNEVVVQVENGSHCRTSEKLISVLKLAGFVNISKPAEINLSDETKSQILTVLKTKDAVSVVSVQAQKPSYEVGASVQLSFAKKPAINADTARVWSLSAADVLDDEVDIIDSDALLNEDDLKKPDPTSLRVDCSTAGKKKKACKNCTCGLADELDEASKQSQPKKSAASACGSCYLGDAFRCSSCPYLGMPAFKSGEKVQLSARQMNADL